MNRLADSCRTVGLKPSATQVSNPGRPELPTGAHPLRVIAALVELPPDHLVGPPAIAMRFVSERQAEKITQSAPWKREKEKLLHTYP